ncbi:MAG: SDR family oxidoreductase [Candidatus Accumulibacter sp.]|jgi:NAD(P)-dependent dehydrogenase (short-subunit alcohol dehydrogenase family)|nr:SDR family oxidoreductase [Accumulibacter sp.]
MNLNLAGKVVIVTGGGAGIGKETALEFAREGCRVAICGRNPGRLEEAKKELEALNCQTCAEIVDVADIPAMEAFAAKVAKTLGGIDVWVNNAGIAQSWRIDDVTEDDWDNMMSTNLKAVFFNSRLAARHMKESRKGGAIINVSSFASVIPNPTRAVYAVSKIGINSLTRTFAAEYAPHGIRVVAVAPGSTETEMNRMLKNPVDNMALNRHGEVGEIAQPIVFLASAAASYITGTTVEVSGGKLCVQRPLACWGVAGS